MEEISKHRQEYMLRPPFAQPLLASTPDDVVDWLVLRSREPSSSMLLKHAAVRKSSKVSTIAIKDDNVLRVYARAVTLTPDQAQTFKQVFAELYPADLRFLAGLSQHIDEQVEKGEGVILW